MNLTPIPKRRGWRRMRSTAAAVLALTVAGTAVWAITTPASAATGAPLVSAGSLRCLDVVGNVSTAGTPLDIWDCNGQANQAYEFTSAGEIRTFDSTRCLDAENNATAPGTRVLIWTCTGSANQKWQQQSDGSIKGTQSGLCLDVSGGITTNGTAVVLWTCNGQTNQRWTTPAASSTLTVDAATVVRPVTRVGNGTLYGLKNAATPSVALMQPLKLNQLRQPPPGTEHRPNGETVPIGDTLVIAPNAMAIGAKITVDMADIYDGFPYYWGGWTDWLARVDKMVAATKARPDITNINAWEPWNEPDWTWPTATAGTFNDGWTRTYRQLRKSTTLPIMGPSDSWFDIARMRSFLTAAKANNTVPDVISWHELSGWQYSSYNIRTYRALEVELGISPRPISINEYATTGEIDVPSSVNHYIAQFEREGVRDAERAFWYEAGTLNGLLYNNKPTASYWMYKWYADQTGNIVKVTPTVYNDAVAAYDASTKTVRMVVAGQSGNTNVRVNGLSALGSAATVTIDYIAGTGRTTNVAAATRLSSTAYTISSGSITVPISNQDPYGAYQIVITPR
jgi:ricin-type beta-trefoil lectin protein